MAEARPRPWRAGRDDLETLGRYYDQIEPALARLRGGSDLLAEVRTRCNELTAGARPGVVLAVGPREGPVGVGVLAVEPLEPTLAHTRAHARAWLWSLPVPEAPEVLGALFEELEGEAARNDAVLEMITLPGDRLSKSMLEARGYLAWSIAMRRRER